MSVTFVSSEDGFVLGQVACRGTLCYGLAKTVDAGDSWTFVADLPMAPVQNQPITKVRFANARDGWAFGPQLWATHDGGVSWHQLATTTHAFDVEASAGLVYLLAAGCSTDSCATPAKLLKAAVASDTFAAVAGATPIGNSGQLALHGKAVWVFGGAQGSGPSYLSSTDGVSWQRRANPCPQGTGPSSLAGIAPATTSTVYLLCASDPGAGSETKAVLLSTDGGATVHLTAAAPARGGIASGIAAASASVVAVGAQSGASWIYRSGDAGRTWASAFEKGDGGLGIADLGFTTSTQGVAIYGTPGNGNPSQLLMTRDAGGTWAPVTF
jgi:photosystem II stability/assembly factor-like uncharacterized protein